MTNAATKTAGASRACCSTPFGYDGVSFLADFISLKRGLPVVAASGSIWATRARPSTISALATEDR